MSRVVIVVFYIQSTIIYDNVILIIIKMCSRRLIIKLYKKIKLELKAKLVHYKYIFIINTKENNIH